MIVQLGAVQLQAFPVHPKILRGWLLVGVDGIGKAFGPCGDIGPGPERLSAIPPAAAAACAAGAAANSAQAIVTIAVKPRTFIFNMILLQID